MAEQQGLLLLLFTSTTTSNYQSLCFIGDTLYGSVADPWEDTIDPRTLMGTFTLTPFSDTASPLTVDYDSPIYQHRNFDVDSINFIFRITDVGWVISEDAAPSIATSSDIQLTCFHDDIADCTTYSWFEGYNSNTVPVHPMGITIGSCNS